MDKEAFYKQLQATFEDAHRRDMLLMMGDLNAKVGSEKVNNDMVMGKEGCGVQNDNMVIGGAIFLHRNIHKLTWTSLNAWDQNQIDNPMVNSMWCRSLLDVKVRKGADVGSDHPC